MAMEEMAIQRTVAKATAVRRTSCAAGCCATRAACWWLWQNARPSTRPRTRWRRRSRPLGRSRCGTTPRATRRVAEDGCAAARVRPSFVGAATLLVEGRCAVVAHPFGNERGDAASGEGGGGRLATTGATRRVVTGGGRRAFLRFPLDDAPAIEALLSARPGRGAVAGGSGMGDEERRLGVAQRLMDAGILVVA